jgi:membrane protease YdiL (CAAX protease family)
MNNIFQNEKLLAVFAILSILILFFLYYYLTSKRIFSNFFLKILSDSVSEENLKFVSDKVAGIIFTGIIPYFIFILIFKILPADAGFTAGRIYQIKLILAGLILVTLFVSFLSSKNQKIQDRSPELRIKTWHPGRLLLSSACWMVYIFGYEFFFRGILWFLCYSAFGFWPALAVNILLYSLVHIPKGRFIAIGAIPLGIIFCILSYTSGSFFPAFLIHATMAISAEIFSVFNNPEFKFQVKRHGE